MGHRFPLETAILPYGKKQICTPTFTMKINQVEVNTIHGACGLAFSWT